VICDQPRIDVRLKSRLQGRFAIVIIHIKSSDPLQCVISKPFPYIRVLVPLTHSHEQTERYVGHQLCALLLAAFQLHMLHDSMHGLLKKVKICRG